ncbi:MAG: HNH endonuclease [Butyrivibrio sp.]|nr:HNH endonuclease [Butyrivibrio sp.]
MHWGICMRGQKHRKAEIKRLVLAKTDGVCARCGRVISFEKATIEHFIPKYRGGSDDERNLLPLCKNCNKQKGSRIVTVEDYYPFLKAQFCAEANEYKLEWKSEKNIKVAPKSYDVLAVLEVDSI